MAMAGNEDTSYVPKSPDFSSFLAQASPAPNNIPLLDNHTRQSGYDQFQYQHYQHYQQPVGSYQFSTSSVSSPAYTQAVTGGPAPQLHHQQQHAQNKHDPQHQHQQHQHHNNHLPQFQPHPPTSIPIPAQGQPTLYGHGAYPINPVQQRQHQQQEQHFNHYDPHFQQHPQYSPPGTYTAPLQQDLHSSSYPQAYTNPQLPSGSAPPNQQTENMPPRRRAAQPAIQAPVIEPSPVRTKFPTARIKRIMQADEEVGKVAQQTPIAVGKALELFMISMVSKSAEVAKDKGQKRVTAQMLKQVVETDEQFDFLRDIVGKVEIGGEEKTKNSRVKGESESDEDIPEPKRRGRGGGRKKRTA